MSKTFAPHFRRPVPPEGFIPSDPDYAAFLAKKIARRPDLIGDSEAFAAISSFQPTTKGGIQTVVGYTQAPYIGDNLLPVFYGAVAEEASYPVLKDEKFVSDNTVIAIGARPKRVDVTVDWRKVTLRVHSLETPTDRRELDASVTLPISLDVHKLDVIKTQIQNERETEQATLLRATGSYTSGFHAAAPTYLWDLDTGVPITDIYKKKATIRKGKARRFPDTLWMGEDVANALSFNKQITEIIKYTGTKVDLGTGVPMDSIASLLRLNVFVGGAGSKSIGGTVADIWSVAAGLLITAPGELIAPRFGLTVASEGYPFVDAYEDKEVGPKGGLVQKYSDAFYAVLTCASGDTTSQFGYLWEAASNAL